MAARALASGPAVTSVLPHPQCGPPAHCHNPALHFSTPRLKLKALVPQGSAAYALMCGVMGGGEVRGGGGWGHGCG